MKEHKMQRIVHEICIMFNFQVSYQRKMHFLSPDKMIDHSFKKIIQPCLTKYISYSKKFSVFSLKIKKIFIPYNFVQGGYKKWQQLNTMA